MSTVDETPSYYIQEGKIYEHHRANHYRSAGFICGEDARNEYICEATPRNINNFLQSHPYVYNYDTSQNQKHINSNYKDAFNNDIFIGDKVLFMDCYGDGSFCGYMEGEVRGFTEEFVKIIPTKLDRYHSCSVLGGIEWMRKPYRVVVLNN